MDYTILAPNIFNDVWIGMVVLGPLRAGQPVTLMGEGRRKQSFVAVDDVAAFAIAAVGHPAVLGQTIVIGGPEAVSWRDTIATCKRVLGREIPVRSVAPGEPVPGLPNAMAQFLAAFETYDLPIDMKETAGTFGVTLTPLEAWVRKAVA